MVGTFAVKVPTIFFMLSAVTGVIWVAGTFAAKVPATWREQLEFSSRAVLGAAAVVTSEVCDGGYP
jgi:hypothetical protein